MDQKPLAIAAVGYSDGLRAFVHSGDGKVKVVGNEAELDDILSSTDSKNSKKGQWEPGTLQAFCSTQSNLAAFEGQDGLILGLCCQLPDDALALYRRDYKWRLVTEFIGIQRARYGTALATVSSLIAKKVVLFFQDEDGYVCCRRGTWHGTESWRWDSARRLAEAAPGSGIAATSWKREDDLEEIGLYYQDARLQTVELRLSFSDCGPSDTCNTPHSPTPIKEAGEPVSMQVLAAVSWGSVPDIRLYLRDNSNIWQFKPIEGTKQKWCSQLVALGNISPRTNLAAVARTPRGSDAVVIDILYWSVDKTLNHKLFVHRRGWQETTSIGRRLPVMTPPRLVDPYDMAFSGNAIRLEALNEQMGVRDALWTLCNHAKWLKKEVESTSFKRAEDLLENASRIFHPATITNPELSKYVVRHIAALVNLVVRLSRMPAGDSRGRDDLLQQCKVQAARVEVAIESWPDMCAPLQENLTLAEHISEGTSLDEIEAFEGRFDDICQVFSFTVARGKEQPLERGSIKIFLATALVAERREALKLDEMEYSVRQNSRKARKLRERFTASKTRAQSFSTLLVQSTMLPLQSSAQGFARALVEMLEELNLNSPSAHGAHARMFSDLRKQLAAIAV